MARKIYASFNFNQNEIQNAKVQNLAVAPATPTAGQIYFDTALNFFRYYDGTSWISLKATPSASNIGTGTAIYGLNAGAMEFKSLNSANTKLTVTTDGATITLTIDDTKIDHTNLMNKGSNTHAQIDTHIASTANPHATTATQVGLGNVTNDAQLKAADLDNDANLTASSASKIPSQQAVKNYVDNKITGIAWKASVRAASLAANIVLSGTQTIDGVVLIAGDRVLLKAQTNAYDNGIYVVAAGAWSRAFDNDSAVEMMNATVMVQEGTVNADTQWTCSTNAPITIGTTPLAWAQLSGAGSVAGGTGITVTGNVVAIDATVVQKAVAATLTNKTIDANGAGNSISNLETADFMAGVIDTDGALANNSDTKLATQKATKTYADTKTKYFKTSLTAQANITINAATHGCGLAPIVQIYETSGGNSLLVEADVSIVTASGDVTVTMNANITGYIVIIGR